MAKKFELNARVTKRVEINPTLIVLRVEPESELFPFIAGQYTVIGLPASAPRVAFSDPEEKSSPPGKLIRRAYSISSSSQVGEFVEFYIALVRSGELTPRLFAMQEDDPIWLAPKATGQFTLDQVQPGRDLLMISTGTGLAPYISMVRSAFSCGEKSRFIVVHGARFSWDLGYRAELEALDHNCRTFFYFPTITRPEEDPSWSGHVGRVHEVFESGDFKTRFGSDPDPETMSVFLCGNPDMIEGMQKRFLDMGFTLHSKKQPGNLHVEKYW